MEKIHSLAGTAARPGLQGVLTVGAMPCGVLRTDCWLKPGWEGMYSAFIKGKEAGRAKEVCDIQT